MISYLAALLLVVPLALAGCQGSGYSSMSTANRPVIQHSSAVPGSVSEEYIKAQLGLTSSAPASSSVAQSSSAEAGPTQSQRAQSHLAQSDLDDAEAAFEKARVAHEREDYAAAARWYRRAADQGNADAQFALGSMYLNGTAGRTDYAEALLLIVTAAEQGHAGALSKMGAFYENGVGVRQDRVQALMYYSLGALRGEETADAAFDRLAGEMSQEQLLEASARSGAWIDAYNARLEKRQRKAGQTRQRVSSKNDRSGAAPQSETAAGDVLTGNTISVWTAPGHKEDMRSPAELRMAAERGDATAQTNLGSAYMVGSGVSQDFAEAAHWSRLAAMQGVPAAQFNLAMLHSQGFGVPVDHVTAAQWYRRAAQGGFVLAQFNLAAAYEEGQGVPQDFVEAARWYRRAAKQGFIDAQFNLAIMYNNGRGVPKDESAAAYWYQAAAEQGYPVAQFNLAVMFQKGLGVRQDQVEALKWYGIAAAQGDLPAQEQRPKLAAIMTTAEIAEAERRAEEWRRAYAARQADGDDGSSTIHENANRNDAAAQAQGETGTTALSKDNDVGTVPESVPASTQAEYEAAMAAYDRGDYAAAARQLRRPAEQGHSEAQNTLGLLYAKGQGLPQDHSQAARWFRRAADQGNDAAQKNLGRLYYHGEGVRQDYVEAARWYREAAVQGNPRAQVILGEMSYQGQGMRQSYSKAVRWYRMAAEQNHAGGQGLLGMMYALGEGVPKDLVTAKMWLILADYRGEGAANATSRRLNQYLTAAEIAEAERRAEAWRRAYRARQRG